MKKLFRFGLLLFVGGSMLVGCYSDLQDLEFGDLKWSPDLALPLVNSSFTLTDLLEELDSTIAYSEENGVLIFTIDDDSLFSSSARDFYNLPDKTFPTIPITLTSEEIDEFNTNGQVAVSRSLQLPYDSNLDSIFIEAANMNVALEENFPASGNFSLDISAAGVDLMNYQYVWNYNGLNPISSDSETNAFSDARFILNSTTPTTVDVAYTLVLTRAFSTNLVVFQNSLNLDLSMSEAQFAGLYGDLSRQDVVSEINTIETNFLSEIDELKDVSYYFEDPRLSLIYTNSMGVPGLFDVETFTYYIDGTGTDVTTNGSIELPPGQIGQPSVSSLSFDEQIKSIINNQPDSVVVAISGVLDPNNTPENFVTGDSYVQVGYRLELPLQFSLSGVSVEDDFGVSGIDPQNTERAIIRIATQNELPLDVSLKAVALDVDSVELKTLFDGLVLGAGSLNNATENEAFIELENDPNTVANELDFLNNTERIGIQVTVATTNNGNQVVEVSSEAEIKFQMAIQTKYGIVIGENE